MFFPGEKLVERAGGVLDGYVYGCWMGASDVGIDGGKVLVREFGQVEGVELVRHRRGERINESFDFNVPPSGSSPIVLLFALQMMMSPRPCS